MRIGVNGWRIHGPRTGVGRYLLNVVRHWTREAVNGRVEAIRFYTPRPLDRHVLDVPPTIHERVLSSRAPMLVWENVRLGPVADDDVLFCPSYSRPLVTRARTVVATHDATLHLFPELFPPTARVVHDRLYGWSARNATLVVTLSEASRADVIRAYGVSPGKVRVVPLAPAEVFGPMRDEKRLAEARARIVGSNAPFFLFVGKLSGRRRIPVLIEAFAEVRRRGLTDHALVIVGLDTHNVGVRGLAVAASVGPHVVHHEYVSDDDLNALYNGAEMFVMPSTYEPGASLPVLEAQATGTPVITVDTRGSREITGDSALLVPELTSDALADAMTALARSPRRREELAARGRDNARRFSWKRCSMETLAVLEEAGTR